jgi:hypothetical protein
MQMKTILKLAIFLLTVSAAASAQVSPAATGPNTVPISGNLQYAFRYAQAAQFATIEPTVQTSAVSGTLNYANMNERRPFVLDYGGGYTWTLLGPEYETGLFQRMRISQGSDFHKWKFLVSDDVSYLPQSPTTGFSGVPGTGEPIGVPNPAPSTSQTILTLNTHALDNMVSGEVVHAISFATTVSANGGWEILRYPDGNGLDTNSVALDGRVAQRLTGRNSLLGRYVFSRYTYPASTVSVTTNTGYAGFRRMWSRNLVTEFSAGPQWTASTDNSIVPTNLNFASTANLLYKFRYSSANVTYNRGTNGGSGYLVGAKIDQLQGGVSRQLGINWNVGLTMGYSRTSGLDNNGSTNATFGGAQATWHASRNLIVFASYTGTNQSSSSALPTNALNQLWQVIGFGFGYSPRVAHLRQ